MCIHCLFYEPSYFNIHSAIMYVRHVIKTVDWQSLTKLQATVPLFPGEFLCYRLLMRNQEVPEIVNLKEIIFLLNARLIRQPVGDLIALIFTDFFLTAVKKIVQMI